MCVCVCVSLDGVRASIKLMSFAWIVKHSISFKTISPWLDLCFNILSFSLKWREISMCFCGQDASLTIRALYHGYVCQAWIQTMVINSSTEAESPKPTPRPKYRQANAKRECVCVYVPAQNPLSIFDHLPEYCLFKSHRLFANVIRCRYWTLEYSHLFRGIKCMKMDMAVSYCNKQWQQTPNSHYYCKL